jgi:hypothetical protein
MIFAFVYSLYIPEVNMACVFLFEKKRGMESKVKCANREMRGASAIVDEKRA